MSKEFEANMKKAIEMCSSDLIVTSNYDKSFSKIYPFATENISEYIGFFDLDGKSLLTVGSSGDQAINAILNGAKEVTEIDIQPFAKYYYYLKMASILCFDMQDFINFMKFFNFFDKMHQEQGNNCFSKEKFDRVKDTLKVLNGESYEFWNNLFIMFDSITIRKGLFYSDNRTAVLKKCNVYLSDSTCYEEARKRIQIVEPKFIHQDVVDCNLPEKFDNIWLSNVAGYLNPKRKTLLFNKIADNLNPDGQLLMEYLYMYKKCYELEYDGANQELYEDPRIFTISGCEGTEGALKHLKDAVLMYRKK